MYIGVDSNGDIYYFTRSYKPYKLYNKKIVNIGYNGEIILENGKAYVPGPENQLICINEGFDELRNEKIVNINGSIVILENGKVYEFDENDQLICINEMFDEIKNEKIVNINKYIIILENGKAYVPGPENQLICINDEFEELRNEKIINIGYDEEIILENGKAYEFDENGQLLCINDKIEELKNKKIVNVSNNLILLEDGSIYNIADNELINYNQPKLILKGKNIEKISAGKWHTVALDENGKVYTWGYNGDGQLGDGTNNDSNIPICISDISTSPLNKVKIKEISAGKYHTVAIDEEGKVYAWGRNSDGQLGDGTNNDSNIPICISDIFGNELYNQKVLKISANGYWTIIIDKNGKIYIFGRNEGAV